MILSQNHPNATKLIKIKSVAFSIISFRAPTIEQMKDVYIVQCLMETDLYKLLKTQVPYFRWK